MVSLLLSVVLLSGCVQLDIYQKVKRNGYSDISITVKSEYPKILDSLKAGLEVDPSMQDKYIYEEIDDGVRYNFSDVNTQKDTLFKGGETSDLPLNISNTKKEFKFPYYYYTVEITIPGEQSDDVTDGSGNGDSVIGYTVEFFGEMVETNGHPMDDNKVKFNIVTDENKIHYVKFRDFILTNWFSRLF